MYELVCNRVALIFQLSARISLYYLLMNRDYLVSNLKVTVPEYKESKIEGNTVFYVLELTYYDNKWTIDKRFSQFDGLVKTLKANYANIPALPGKSLFKMGQKELESRRKGLEEFLQALVIRKDLVNSEQVKQFLQLDRNAAQIISNPPKFLYEFSIQGSNSKGVRDFAYVNNELFYIVTADMNPISRLNAYVTNAKMPWQKDTSTKEKVLLEVGSVEAWVGSGSNYVKKWAKYYPTQAICLEYSQAGEKVFVGLDDGILDMLRVTPIQFEDQMCIKVHNARVMGIYYDSINSVVYTISEDKTLRIGDGTSLTQMNSIPHRDPLLIMNADKLNKRLFIGTKGGEVFLYDISTKHNARMIHTYSTRNMGAIRGMALDINKNYLFTGGFDDGQICTFNIDKPGKEKLGSRVASFQGKQKCRALAWSGKRMEIFSGTADGAITFWDSTEGQTIYVLDSAKEQVTKIDFVEAENKLVVSHKNKVIKFWELPLEWTDSVIKKKDIENAVLMKKRYFEQKLKETLDNIRQDSDEDDLVKWHLDE